MLPLPLHLYFAMAALATSCLFFRSLKSHLLQGFAYFLAFIVIVEVVGRALFKILHEPNGWLYNLSVPVEYLFYGWIFHKKYQSTSFKSLAGWFVVLFATFSIINNCIQGLYEFHTNTLQIGSFFMIVLSLMFYVDVYKDLRPVQQREIFARLRYANENIKERPRYYTAIDRKKGYRIKATIPKRIEFLQQGEERESLFKLLRFYLEDIIPPSLPNREIQLTEIESGHAQFIFDENDNFYQHLGNRGSAKRSE